MTAYLYYEFNRYFISESEPIKNKNTNCFDNPYNFVEVLKENIPKHIIKYFHNYIRDNKPLKIKLNMHIDEDLINNKDDINNFEKNFILDKLQENNYSIRKTANNINIAERTLYRKLKKYNINVKLFKSK